MTTSSTKMRPVFPNEMSDDPTGIEVQQESRSAHSSHCEQLVAPQRSPKTGHRWSLQNRPMS